MENVQLEGKVKLKDIAMSFFEILKSNKNLEEDKEIEQEVERIQLEEKRLGATKNIESLEKSITTHEVKDVKKKNNKVRTKVISRSVDGIVKQKEANIEDIEIDK